MKSQSTVGAGDSMVGAMTLKLAESAPFADIVRYGVAAGSAATLNQGTRLCALDDTQKYTRIWLSNDGFPCLDTRGFPRKTVGMGVIRL